MLAESKVAIIIIKRFVTKLKIPTNVGTYQEVRKIFFISLLSLLRYMIRQTIKLIIVAITIKKSPYAESKSICSVLCVVDATELPIK